MTLLIRSRILLPIISNMLLKVGELLNLRYRTGGDAAFYKFIINMR
jgi:hypothetical protein